MKSKITAFSALLLSIPAMLFAWGGNPGMCGYGTSYWHMGPRWSGGFYGGGFIMMIITLILLGLLLFMAVKYLKNSRPAETGDNSLNILKNRYAKGEISKEEFFTMKKELKEV